MGMLREIVDTTERIVRASDKSKCIRFYCHHEHEYFTFLTPEGERDCPHDGSRMELVSGAHRVYHVKQAPHSAGTWRWSRQVRADVRLKRMAQRP